MKKRYWISIIIAALLFVFAGGYIVYPKTPYIVYESEKYYGMPEDEVLVSKDKHKIEILLDDSNVATINLENDYVLIQIDLDNDFALFIAKDGLTFHGDLQFKDEEVNPSLLKYAVLAKDWQLHSIIMMEDYTIIYYVPISIVLLLSLIGLLIMIDKKDKKNKIPLIILFSTVSALTTIVNLFLVITHL